jgi:hypothetical protein
LSSRSSPTYVWINFAQSLAPAHNTHIDALISPILRARSEYNTPRGFRFQFLGHSYVLAPGVLLPSGMHFITVQSTIHRTIQFVATISSLTAPTLIPTSNTLFSGAHTVINRQPRNPPRAPSCRRHVLPLDDPESARAARLRSAGQICMLASRSFRPTAGIESRRVNALI